MKLSNVFLVLLAAMVGLRADAADQKPLADPKIAELVRASIPLCATEITLTESIYDRSFGPSMKPLLVRVDSKDATCVNELLVITTTRGNAYVGRPWFLERYEGTVEAKLKAFVWEALHENVEPLVRAERNIEGLRRVDLMQTTESGKIPMRGVVDNDGKTFFIGDFYPLNVDRKREMLTSLERLLARSPSRGAASAPVSLVEFSDFQCPSCRRSATYIKPILAKYGDKIRYTRFDLPLMSHHPWAFGAAVSGRAIYRQNPELFWKYKDAIYDNQENLNAFTLADFARGFASDHQLDLARYDADLASPEVLQQILDGVGASFTLQIHGTPSYLINGTLVNAGKDGEALDQFISRQLATPAAPAKPVANRTGAESASPSPRR